MAIQTSAGTTLAISAALPATFNATGYDALTFLPVGEITELPSFGSVYSLVTHSPLAEREITKRKGSVNHGTMALSFASDAGDTGQTAFKTASAADTEVAIEITYPDGEIDYTTALVMGFTQTPGGADSIKQGGATLELTRALVNVAAV